MWEKWLYYMREMVINTVLFFIVWVVLDLVFGQEVDYGDAALRAVFFGIVMVPVIEWINRKRKQ